MTALASALVRTQIAARAFIDRQRNEDGDVPGWVLVTLMTAGLVTVIWALASNQLQSLFQKALNSVKGP